MRIEDMTIDDKRSLLLQVSRYKSQSDSVNAVYLGTLATANLMTILGGRYGVSHLEGLVEAADESRLDDALAFCRSTIDYMIANPRVSCPCCGQITTPERLEASTTTTISKDQLVTTGTISGAQIRDSAVMPAAEQTSFSAEAEVDCAFYYFLPSGKWKYSGLGRFPRAQNDGFKLVDREAVIQENGGMPGINSRAASMMVLMVPMVNCHELHAYPRLLQPEY